MRNIVIIDYGLCNLLSVFNAFKFLGVNSMVTDEPHHLASADAVVLPGVGAFQDGMKGLAQKNFINPLKKFVQTGKPFLGICLGMQMLMTKSFEFGEFQGLNLIEGEVVPFRNTLQDKNYDFKVPHIGWNSLRSAQNSWQGTILEGLEEEEQMYFVHSFYALPIREKNVLAKTEYGNVSFCSVNQQDNIYGCQFHPEKSSGFGLKILQNFVRLVK